MRSVEIRLLGGFEARLPGGKVVRLPTRKAGQLIACLALAPGSQAPREKLAGLLWSERADEQARASLRQALAAIRKSFQGVEPFPIAADGERIALNVEAAEVDALEFQALAEEGSAKALERAAALYRGELLEGAKVRDPAFEEWLSFERERLRGLAVRVLGRLLAHQASDGRAQEAIGMAQRLLELDPLREEAHRALMRLYAEAGERGLAVRQFEGCRALLGAELGVEPEAETQALFEGIRKGGVGVAPSKAAVVDLPKAMAEDPDFFALPDRPSIAVLPFQNLSDDAEQEYFTDGITEDITTELSRFRDLFVISSLSSLTYREKMMPVQQVGRELGVHYVLEGGVRRAGSRIRITTQLTDASTGQHLWAERYDRDFGDIFEVQDEVTQTIVSTLAGRLEDIGRKRAMSKTKENVAAYDYVLQARGHLFQGTKESILKARELLRKAIELDPGYATAYAWLADSYNAEYDAPWSEAPEEALSQALQTAQKAVSRDDGNSLAHLTLGAAYLSGRQYDLAEAQIERALALNPNEYWNYCLKGWFLALIGRSEEGIECGKRAIRCNPFASSDCRYDLGAAYYTERRYDDAIAAFHDMPEPDVPTHGFLAACCAQLGRDGEARAAMAEFKKIARTEMANYPGDDRDRWRAVWLRWVPYKDPANLGHLLEGLEKAGLYEGSEPAHSRQAEDSAALSLPDKPSIAVLPFVNLSGDPEQEYFSDGITEDIITELSKSAKNWVWGMSSRVAFARRAIGCA
jgi:TolB-like protein/Flp pilus assembly protein TadD